MAHSFEDQGRKKNDGWRGLGADWQVKPIKVQRVYSAPLVLKTSAGLYLSSRFDQLSITVECFPCLNRTACMHASVCFYSDFVAEESFRNIGRIWGI